MRELQRDISSESRRKAVLIYSGNEAEKCGRRSTRTLAAWLSEWMEYNRHDLCTPESDGQTLEIQSTLIRCIFRP